MALLFLAACANPADPADKTEEPLPDLAPPYIAAFAAAGAGTFRTDCLMHLDLEDTDGSVLQSAEMTAVGGEWTGLSIEEGVQYKALLTWSSCTNAPAGAGTFESSVFSGAPGDFFLFRYNGVAEAFETVIQRADFDGAEVDVTFVDGTADADVQALADSYGVTASVVSGAEYRVTWDDTTPVGAVLAEFSTADSYLSGAPSWIVTPDWW